MTAKITGDLSIRKLAENLSEGNKKGALSTIRSRLSGEFQDDYQQLVWEGWKRALEREEPSSLIFQLLNGLEDDQAKISYQDIKKKKNEILIRDHTQTTLSKYYITTWVSLLEIYCNICQEKQ
ncbi:MAG: hypothetical protein GPJ52_13800 [Candidatus Heimdallarchaeota archaeon]|nr:hypothetical protein [Candidatus Heimdallarchaeota archaeon]